MKDALDWLRAVAVLVGFFVLFVGLLALSSAGNEDKTPEQDSAADVYESQLEADYRREAASDPKPASETTCVDVTSYDQNWDNDMLCTRPDGSTFYTDYAGASQYE